MLKLMARLVAFVGALVLLTTAPALAQEERSDWLDIEVGKSIVLELPQVPRAISVTNPVVADIVQLGSATRWQVQGSRIGTTDLVIQFNGNLPPMIYEVTVHRDLSDLIRRVDSIVDGEPPRIYPLAGRIVVEGPVADLDTLERVSLVTSIFDGDFINLMTVRGDHQVQLEVIFAEVSRTGTREMGINLAWLPAGIDVLLTDGSAMSVDSAGVLETLFNPTSLNIYAAVAQGVNIVGLLNILDNYQLAKLIAQPTLVSMSGQQAEFLAGGQVPLPTPNAQGNVTIKFQAFGTQLRFTPTVLSNDVIDIQVGLELSEIDDAASVRLGAFSIPGFSVRSVYSHVRLRSGETFAIAGLLKERITMVRAEVPGLGRIPVLGALFRKISHYREETEIMVYVTPRLIRPMAPGEVPPVLGTTENNNPSDLALFLLGADRRAKSRTANPTGDVGLQR